MILKEAIQAALDAGNNDLAEHLKNLNPENNADKFNMEVKISAKLEKFNGEKTEDSQPVEVIHIDIN